MGFISYAQNFEDVMLRRALAAESPGFWIDIGAADPVIDSVTLAFSDLGWRGINVEPRPAGHARLAAARPRDINLQLAVAAHPGRLVFHEYQDGGLSTLDPAIAARHWGETLAAQVAAAVAIAVLSVLLGLLLSYHADLPAGPAIVLTTGAFWTAGLLAGPRFSLRQRLRSHTPPHTSRLRAALD